MDATTVALASGFATGDGKESERNDREDTSQHVSTSKKRTVTADGVFIYLDGSPSFTLTPKLCSLLDPPHASQHQKLFESDEGPESWWKSSCQVPTTQLDDPRPDETSSSAVTLAQTTPLASRYLSFPVTGLF